MSDPNKPSLEVALDLLVYAPLGLALEARTLLPTLVERGRNQVTMARMIGQFAVQQGQVEANKRLGPVQEQVEAVLADLGLVDRPAPSRPTRPDRPDASTTIVTTATSATRVSPSDRAAASAASAQEPRPADESRPAAAPERADAVPDVSSLAVPDYDSLAASQVVPRLKALAPDELEAVQAYEAARRARKTILNRIVQLQSD